MAGLEDLRKVVLSERETGRLTQIPPDLYDRAHAAITALMERVYAIEDPLSDEARTLIEETVSIRETVADLFALRARKSLSLAVNHAQGHYIDREELRKLIPQEREMFDRIAAAIATCQDALVQNTTQARLTDQGSAGATPAASQEAPVAAVVGPQSRNPPAPAAVSGGPAAVLAPAEYGRKAPGHSRSPYTLIRVLADMDTFMGVDGRTYDLAQGDILMLPERNAEVLIDRNRAQMIRPSMLS